MTHKENITAILECYFTGFKEEIIDSACNRILEQQPCEDCISRRAVLDAINTYDKFGYTETGCFVREPEGDYVPYIHYDDVIKCVQNVPSVTPKEKTGRWISFGIQGEIDGQIVRAFTCSRCGAISIFRVSNGNIVNGDLCPNCGVKMQEVQNGNDKRII